MATTFTSLGLDGLNVDEKLELVGHLWDDLVASAPRGGLLNEAQCEEPRRRIAVTASRPNDWVAWEDALAATLRRLAG